MSLNNKLKKAKFIFVVVNFLFSLFLTAFSFLVLSDSGEGPVRISEIILSLMPVFLSTILIMLLFAERKKGPKDMSNIAFTLITLTVIFYLAC